LNLDNQIKKINRVSVEALQPKSINRNNIQSAFGSRKVSINDEINAYDGI
jgi:hypothetical protein